MLTWLRHIFHDDEEGTALTEMAIMLPVILILLLWANFFSDISVVRLKVLEATRMAVWETTVFRSPTEIQKEVVKRFQDLRSTDTANPKKPEGFLSINKVKVKVKVQSNLAHVFVGQANFGDKGSAGTKLVGGIAKGLNSILGYMGMNTKARSQADVSISVSNDLIPTKMSIFHVKIGDKVLTKPLVFKDSGEIVYDPWKAWPHRKPGAGSAGTANDTDVYKSYPVAEKYTASKVKDIAFFGLNKVGFFSKTAEVVDKLGLPVPWLVSSFQQDHKGPVAMLPAAPIKEGWVPGHGLKPYKVGQLTYDTYKKSGPGAFDTPSWGIDRARPTLPFKIASPKWAMMGRGGNVLGALTSGCDGGYCKQELSKDQAENDYYKTYECRGHYYEGMVDPNGKPGAAKFFGLVGANKDYNGCESRLDQVADGIGKYASGLGSLLGGL